MADFLRNEEIPAIQKLRDTQLTRVFRLGELKDMMQGEAFQAFRQEHVLEERSVADLLHAARDEDSFKAILDYEIRLDGPGISVAAILDTLLSDGEGHGSPVQGAGRSHHHRGRRAGPAGRGGIA